MYQIMNDVCCHFVKIIWVFLSNDYVTKPCKFVEFFWQNLEVLQLFYVNLGIEGWIIPSKKCRISIENVLNCKIADPIEIYNFDLGPFSIWVRLNNLKIWISKFENFKQNFGAVNDFKWKSQQHQSCTTHRDL